MPGALPFPLTRMLHAAMPWPELVAQIGLSMSATNVIGFTKSSKGT